MSPQSSDRLTSILLNDLISDPEGFSFEAESYLNACRNLRFRHFFAESIGPGLVYSTGDRELVICVPVENVDFIIEEWDDMVAEAWFVCGAKTVTLMCANEVLQVEETHPGRSKFYEWHKIVTNSVNSGSVTNMVATLERAAVAETNSAPVANNETASSLDLVELNIVSEKTGEAIEDVRSRLESSGLNYSRFKGELLVTAEIAAQLIRQWFISQGEQAAQAVFAIAAPVTSRPNQSYEEMEMIGSNSTNGTAKTRAPRKPSLQARRGFKAPKTKITARNAEKYLDSALPTDSAARVKYLSEIKDGSDAANSFVKRLVANSKNKEEATGLFSEAAGKMLDQMATPVAG